MNLPPLVGVFIYIISARDCSSGSRPNHRLMEDNRIVKKIKLTYLAGGVQLRYILENYLGQFSNLNKFVFRKSPQY